MCDYSLQAFKSRPAKVGEKLTTHNFGLGTLGFVSPEASDTAVCVLPGTEIAFDAEVECRVGGPVPQGKVAIFRQVNKHATLAHHDCVEFPNGVQILLTHLKEGQAATILQLPAAPKTPEEAKDQERLAIAG